MHNGYTALIVDGKVIGRALIWGDGSVTITKFGPNYAVFEWEPPPPTYCAACFMGACGFEAKEKRCFCCNCDHISEVIEWTKYPLWFMSTPTAA